jgi:C1A family cysteine protease
MHRYVPPSFGWRPDPPDFRDYTHETASVVQMLRSLKVRRRGGSRPSIVRVDLREFFPEPSDQGRLAASPAHACAALVEYFEQRSLGQDLRAARLFLHHNARRMAMTSQDSAVNLRATLKAVACCGLPPERFWPYDMAKVDTEPDAFLYSFSGRFSELQYVRLDARNARGSAALDVVRSFLAVGFPVAFGVAVPTSISLSAEIPYWPTFDSALGGQALLAVGYDDQWLSSSRGALLVRNSWGPEWGEKGYGWLPYAFVEERLAVDFWTVLRPDWIASGEFLRPEIV